MTGRRAMGRGGGGVKARHADPPNAAMDNDDARRNFISIFLYFSLSLSLSLFFYILYI